MQRSDRSGVRCIATDQAMRAELPNFTQATDRHIRHRRHIILSRISTRVPQEIIQVTSSEAEVDQVDAEALQIADLQRQHCQIPASTFAELVVRQHIGALLCLAEVTQFDHRHLGQPKLARRHDAAVSRDDAILAIDQQRVAILAAGLEAEDPAEQYAIDVLFGIRKTDRDRIIAVDWTRHAIGLSELSFAEFANAYIGELTRIVSGYPDIPMIDAARRVHNLHQRQATVVFAVLEQAVAVNAQRLLRHTLPDTSLLRLVVGLGTSLNLPMPITLAVVPISHPAAIAATEVGAAPVPFPLQVAFFVEGPDHVIQVKHLGSVRGRPAGVAHALRGQFETDRAEGLSRDNHRFVPVGRIKISGEFATDKAARQLIKRCRSELGEFYKAIFQCLPPQPLLIENKPQKGYRLDPDCRVIAPDQAD